MGNAPSNTLEGQPNCRRCGKKAHGGTSRACRLCGTVYCGACKKLHMIKSIGDGLGKDERWACAHNPLCSIKAKARAAKQLEQHEAEVSALAGEAAGPGVTRIQWQWQDRTTNMWHNFDATANAGLEEQRRAGHPHATSSADVGWGAGAQTIRVDFGAMRMSVGTADADTDTGADATTASAPAGEGAAEPGATEPRAPTGADGDGDDGWRVRRYVRHRMGDFMVLKVLGRGAEGKVLLVRKQHYDQETACGEADADRLYAMKVLKKDPRQEGDANWRERMWTERNILANIDHPFLTRLRYAFESRGGLHLVMDLYLGGELFVHLQKIRRFDLPTARFYATEILLALEHLHSLDIVYRDIKPENVLLDRRGHVRLTDFGLSKQLLSPSDYDAAGDESEDALHANSFVGSPEYIAPEVLRREPYGKAADWWGFGAVLFEMLFGRPPFMDAHRPTLFRMILKQPMSEVFGMIPEAARQKIVDDPSGVGAHAFTLLDGLMHKKQMLRLGTHWLPGDAIAASEAASSRAMQRRASRRWGDGAAAVRSHAFFEGIDFDRALRKADKPPFVPTVEDDHDLRNFDFTFTSEEVSRRGATKSSRGGIDLSSLDMRGDDDRRFQNFTYVDDRGDADAPSSQTLFTPPQGGGRKTAVESARAAPVAQVGGSGVVDSAKSTATAPPEPPPAAGVDE